jgi:hypothetical protein
MFLTSQQVVRMTEAELREFVAQGLPEGRHLDYKRALSGKSDDEPKREFLKDVTGFANAQGGHLLIGVDEPAQGSTVDKQIIGLADGDSLAKSLERLAASSIDPRIPGLIVQPVPLTAGGAVIVVHVPPSQARPHMVDHGNHQRFYVRHRESTNPMTTHEIRESVIASLTAEARARQRFAEAEQDVKLYWNTGGPQLLIHAVPIVILDQRWLLDPRGFRDVLNGPRRQRWHPYGWTTGEMPERTIDGLRSFDQRQDPSWMVEVHRDGYVLGLYSDFDRANTEQETFLLHDWHPRLFRGFATLCADIWERTETDVPYAFAAKLLRAHGTMFSVSRYSRHYGPYPKGEITWPVISRAVGQNYMEVAEQMSEGLFNAYGAEYIPEE